MKLNGANWQFPTAPTGRAWADEAATSVSSGRDAVINSGASCLSQYANEHGTPVLLPNPRLVFVQPLRAGPRGHRHYFIVDVTVSDGRELKIRPVKGLIRLLTRVNLRLL